VVSSVTSDYQILLADFTPPIDPDQYSIWHSTQNTNFTHFSNLKIDKLLEDGRRTSDQKLRKEIYQDFQRFLLEDCPAVFLFKSNSYSISRKTLI
jgi:peptide/nickel transport system substrate-binding protein